MSKHGATISVIVNDNIDYALKRLSRLSSGVISEHKRATDHYEKPSSVRHQQKQSMLHKLQLERDIKSGKVIRIQKQSTKR